MNQETIVAWHDYETILRQSNTRRYFREREVWWLALGLNLGAEENGKGPEFSRPVLILRKFNQNFFLGVPLSTVPKRGKYYYTFTLGSNYPTALLSQVRALAASRLINRDGKINREEFMRLRAQLRNLL